MPENDRNAPGAEIQEDMRREELASAFHAAMVGHFRAHVPGTKINEETLLSGDYLNQFSELAALFDVLSTGKKTGRLDQWRPVSYEEHFADANLGDKALAVAAYRGAPVEIRARFDEAVARLQAEALRLVAMAGSTNGKKALKKACAGAADRLRMLVGEAGAIANGKMPAVETPGMSEDHRIAV